MTQPIACDVEFSPALQRICDKLDRLRRDGWKQHAHQHRVEAHRFLLSPPLSEAAVCAFEQVQGIRLPADYRAFLRHVGESGAGPYHGLLPISRWADLAAGPSAHLAQPSKLVPGRSYSDGWDEQLGVAESPFCGLLPLAEIGCGDYCLLVVSGPAHGRIVYAGDAPPYFVWDASFLGWYERWLDELLAGVRVSYFGLTRGGSESELLADYARSTRPDEQAEILASLGRLSPIGEQAHPTLRLACEGEDAVVRAAALHAMARAGRDFAPEIAARLLDPAAKVRQAAVFALDALGALPAYLPSVDAALARETDAGALFSLAHALEKQRALSESTLRPHMQSDEPQIRQYAEYFLRRLPSGQADADGQGGTRRSWRTWFGGPATPAQGAEPAPSRGTQAGPAK